MTPKEKAQDLISKYVHLTKQTSGANGTIYNSKQCALIAVDELIKYHDDLMDVVRYELPSNIVAVIPLKYWEDVKKEIEAL